MSTRPSSLMDDVYIADDESPLTLPGGTLRSTYGQKQSRTFKNIDTITDLRVMLIFWGGVLSTCIGGVMRTMLNNPSDTMVIIGYVFSAIATILYLLNVVCLIRKKVPWLPGGIRGKACSCSGESRSYAVASLVLYILSMFTLLLPI